jgi:hypothetical protein
MTQLNSNDMTRYARHSDDTNGKKALKLLVASMLYFYFTFLVVWFVFLRYVVTAYGSALQHGYALNKAWDFFFSVEAHRALTVEASIFMSNADNIVLTPITIPWNMLTSVISGETISNGIGLIFVISFFGLILVGIPVKLYGWSQKFILGVFDRD